MEIGNVSVEIILPSGQISDVPTENYAGVDIEVLNTKANVDLDNLSATGKSLAAELCMPSSVYDILTVGASGSTYTAPANGYFAFMGFSDVTNGFVLFTNTNNYLVSAISRAPQGSGISTSIPAKKGDVITLSYDAIQTSWSYLVFVYAEGSKQEQEAE